jgi:tripeptide aminopeptidase
MNPERLLATFLELVRIDSPSLREADVAAYCTRVLEQAGCIVTIDDTAEITGSNTGNLFATLPSTLPPAESGAASSAAPSAAPSKLYFSAHMDTVTPGEGIDPQVINGIITAAGPTILGGDDKAGVAAILELIRTLSEGDTPHPEIGVLLSIGEEIGLVGAQAMSGDTFNGEPCFVLDAGGEPGLVIIGAPYHDAFTATFTGKAAHAGVEPEKGISAIALAARAIVAMELGRLDAKTTANVGTITGGGANNIIPDTCVVSGEFRAIDKQRLEEVQAQIEASLQGAVEGSEGDVSIEWRREYAGFSAPENDPLVQLTLEVARDLGLKAQADYTGGGSDANIFALKGLRPVVLGTGMTGIHGLGEQLAVKDLENLAKICISIVYSYKLY